MQDNNLITTPLLLLTNLDVVLRGINTDIKPVIVRFVVRDLRVNLAVL